MTTPPPYEAVLLNGAVGVGKTTTAEALSDLEWAAGRTHAVVDLDAIRLLRPPPAGDPWQHEVELANLRALVANYRAAGAVRFVLSGVVEDAAELPRYHEALGTGRLLTVLLVVDPVVAKERLASRHAGDAPGLAWHLGRHDELAGILNRAAFEDGRIDVAERSARDVALQI